MPTQNEAYAFVVPDEHDPGCTAGTTQEPFTPVTAPGAAVTAYPLQL
jgi:hypothetical protein